VIPWTEGPRSNKEKERNAFGEMTLSRLRHSIERTAMNDLERIFYDSSHRICVKWAHYFRVYERFFSRYRGSGDFRMMEIGVSQGGSLDMWRAYFGPDALIVGVDIDPRCRCYEAGRTLVRIGSQEDIAFLQELVREFREFDVVLDDGGHTMKQQITSFETLYPTLRPDGIYMVEDCHTSYHAPFGGGLRQRGTFIELAKRKIDELNGFHIHSNAELFTEFTQTTTGMSFFDSIVVFEKGPVEPPRMVQTGVGS
jgi:hypothetical protein